jgi:hypothetical protein
VTSALDSLKSFAQPRPADVCGLCSAPVGAAHPHVLELRRRVVECACVACAGVFANASAGRWRVVPPVVEPWPDVRIDDRVWESLHIPIGLAYFVRSSAAARVVAYYPSPAGAVESQLPLETWRALWELNPRLESLAEDVEALLVHRIGTAREAFRVSIDECFALVGLVRSHWRGFTGGQELRDALAVFWDRLRAGGAVA